jgi:hypothetical protein
MPAYDAVIPGCAIRCRPGIHTHDGGYRFRTAADAASGMTTLTDDGCASQRACVGRVSASVTRHRGHDAAMCGGLRLRLTREAAGALATRHSPRPLLFRGGYSAYSPGVIRVAECAWVCLDVIARSGATKQSMLSSLQQSGLLRGACHLARIRATRWLAMTVTGFSWLFDI